jgi:hypothetical protein
MRRRIGDDAGSGNLWGLIVVGFPAGLRLLRSGDIAVKFHGRDPFLGFNDVAAL